MATDKFYVNLRSKALELMPEKKPEIPILVCLYIETSPPPDISQLEREDFGWFSARVSTKISTLRRQADENVTDTLGCQSNQWYLKFNNKNSIDQAATVGSFDSGDGFALFTAAKGDPPPARAPLIPALENSQRVHALSYPGIKPEPIEPHIRNMSPPSSVTKRSTTPVSFIDPFAGYATHQDRALAVEGAVRMLQSPAPFIKPDPALPSPSLTNAPRLENQIRNHQMPHAGVFSPPKLPAVSHIKPEPRQTPEWNMSNFPRSASMSDVPQSPFVGPQYSREASDKSKITDIIKDAFDESNDLSTSPIQLQTLFKDVPVEIMERGIKRGLDLLDKITTSMSTAENEETKAWMAQIDKIRKQAEVQRTVIGVVGNTGAGKSSVINALLDEERLVPTNCMRACTAVVTEISYNSETDHAYRASIEFISESDWLKELKGLYQDLFDEYGDMKNVSRDADAAVAWAKIKAVYPKKIKEQITETTPERLVREGPVQSVLGKSIPIKESDSMRFYKKLQRYVDSQEKAKKDDKKPREMEFWPLIRVVKIFVKSPTLETGAVVVDLPGVHDANAARAAVADSYIQQCTGLWIVAPITRAVDDKSAHKLLGDGFRRQLLMDGGFSSISFICSKSDDVSVSEAILSLNLDDELEPQTKKIEELDEERAAKKRRLKYIHETKSAMQDSSEELDDQINAWEDIKDNAEDGETVYAPKPKPKEDDEKKEKSNGGKRKRSGSSSPPKKVRKKFRIVDDDESEKESDNEGDNEDKEQAEEDKGEPVTLEMIEEKLDELKATKKETRKAKTDLLKQMTEIKAEISELNETIKKLEDVMACRCIDERNKYSTGAIQQDFAAGLRELDQEAAEERDGENFDPEVDIRDYDEVANSLPVFCVSSRGYQKLQGRLKKDGDKPVFQSIDQTGMPALQKHCTKLTESSRLARGRKFLTGVSQLCNSLSLWSSGSLVNLSAADKDREALSLNRKFDDLDHKLDRGIEKQIHDLKGEMKDSIFDRYVDAVDSASEAAPNTVRKWGTKVNRANPAEGGYYWATYKALCRRDGVFTNGWGAHDWNAQLTDPMIKVLAGSWERVFNRRVPNILKGYTKTAKDSILEFHNKVVAQAGPAHAGHLHLLSGQLTTHGDALQALGNEVTELVNTTQREINREFTPVIQGIMHESYEYCMNERGSGSFMRMKAFMEQHVNTHHRRMFEKAVNGVKDKLLALARQAEDVLDENTARLYQEMQRDYHSIFGGHAQDFTGGQGRAIRDAKEKVKTALVGFEKPFREVVGFPDDDEEPKVEVDLSQDEAARQILGENNQAGSIDEDASDNEGEESFVRCTSKPVSGTWFDGDDDGSEDQREIPNSVRQ